MYIPYYSVLYTQYAKTRHRQQQLRQKLDDMEKEVHSLNTSAMQHAGEVQAARSQLTNTQHTAA